MGKIKLSIGIPAYNEELNIKFLIKALLGQEYKNVELEEIILVSDGSSDRTVEYARSVGYERLRVIERQLRKGGKLTQNEIIKEARGDVLILLDADVLPVGRQFVENIVAPIREDKKVGLVGAFTKSAKPTTLFEGVIASSHEFKNRLYQRINGKDNIYLCHGRARALSKSFYTQINWPKNIPEDAYSYLFCLQKGLKFVFAPKAQVIFRSPANFRDHFLQSNRFLLGKKRLEKYFPSDWVKAQYGYSKSLLIWTLIVYLFKNPVSILSYLMVAVVVRVYGLIKTTSDVKWDISTSTKKVIYEKA